MTPVWWRSLLILISMKVNFTPRLGKCPWQKQFPTKIPFQTLIFIISYRVCRNAFYLPIEFRNVPILGKVPVEWIVKFALPFSESSVTSGSTVIWDHILKYWEFILKVVRGGRSTAHVLKCQYILLKEVYLDHLRGVGNSHPSET